MNKAWGKPVSDKTTLLNCNSADNCKYCRVPHITAILFHQHGKQMKGAQASQDCIVVLQHQVSFSFLVCSYKIFNIRQL